MIERPCDCAGHHMCFPERSEDAIAYELLHPPTRPWLRRPISAMHQHEDELCSVEAGIGGCPGIPHCRDWIIGHHNVAISLAEMCGDGARAFEIRLRREWFERSFAGRKPLVAVEAAP